MLHDATLRLGIVLGASFHKNKLENDKIRRRNDEIRSENHEIRPERAYRSQAQTSSIG
jgi:hypothetical protein